MARTAPEREDALAFRVPFPTFMQLTSDASAPNQGGAAPAGGDVPSSLAGIALAFSGVPLAGTPEQVASASVDAVRRAVGGPVCVTVPTRPVPLSVGDPREGLGVVVRFPAPGGEGELWMAEPARVPAPV